MVTGVAYSTVGAGASYSTTAPIPVLHCADNDTLFEVDGCASVMLKAVYVPTV